MGVFIHAFEFSVSGSMVTKNTEIMNFKKFFSLKNDADITKYIIYCTIVY